MFWGPFLCSRQIIYSPQVCSGIASGFETPLLLLDSFIQGADGCLHEENDRTTQARYMHHSTSFDNETNVGIVYPSAVESPSEDSSWSCASIRKHAPYDTPLFELIIGENRGGFYWRDFLSFFSFFFFCLGILPLDLLYRSHGEASGEKEGDNFQKYLQSIRISPPAGVHEHKKWNKTQRISQIKKT